MSSQQPDITLYTSGTPNGQKASITLEELGVQSGEHPDQKECSERRMVPANQSQWTNSCYCR